MSAQPHARDYKSPAYKRMALYFLSFSAGLAALAFYVVFAKANVVVFSTRQQVAADFEIDVARSPADGEVLGDVFEASDTASQTFPVTAALRADAPAEGKVKIASSLGRNQTLIATTRLLAADGRLYRLKEKVTVPARGTVEAVAFADQPGRTSEITEGTFTIPGLSGDLQKLFAVNVSEPFVGGLKEVKLVTQADVDAAAKAIAEKLRTTIALKLREGAGQGDDAKKVVVTSFENVLQTTDVPVGSEAAQFTLTVTVTGRAVTYDKSILKNIIDAKLAKAVPEGRELFLVDDGTSAEVEKADGRTKRARIKVSAKGEATLSAAGLMEKKMKLAGITIEAARKYLEGLDGVSSASVNVRPFWVGRMPNREANIELEVR